MSFELAYDEELDRRFRDQPAASIEPNSYVDYVRWLTKIRSRQKPDGDAASMSGMVVLWRATRKAPGELHAEISEWLVGRVRFFTNAYYHRRDEIEGQGKGTPFGDAELAWTSWLNDAWGELDDKARRGLLESMYMRRLGSGHSETDPYLRDVFPGVDLFRLSMQIVDRWAAAGHPIPDRVGRNEHDQELYLWVVCAPASQGERLYQRRRCDGEVWRHAISDPKLRLKLLAEISKRRDARVTEALFANLGWMSSPHLVDAWRFFESDATQWGAASRVVAELLNQGSGVAGSKDEIHDNAVRLWRARADLRGSILYILAAVDYPAGSSPVRWDQFMQVFGSLVSAKDFDVFLSNGSGAIRRVANVWPALDPGVGAADRLIPYLEKAMEQDDMRREIQRVAYGVLRSLVDVLRERKDRRSLERLRGYFEDRKRRHPSEASIMETYISMTRYRD